VRKLFWHNSFRRAFRKRSRGERSLQEKIFQTLDQLVKEPFHPQLKTHKLKGELDGLWACWVEYDCRIIFMFEPDAEGMQDAILLVELGSHDEVY
jgi:mRNA interferase YafQ